ncbi:hypothetical protein BKA57DRAFT_509737 [Linnemannia elongata]|nr:hypothetical protein BKA57DRAFT_509737 [Linnemannia elongata]
MFWVRRPFLRATETNRRMQSSVHADQILFGVSRYMGGLGGGHYATYAKNEKTGDWYNFDHSHVSIVDNVESIRSSRAYLLFCHCRNATVREYEKKARVIDSEPEPQPSSSSSVIHYGSNLSATTVRNFKIQGRDDDDDGEYGPWGRPPIGPFQDDNDHDNMMSGLDDSDNDLPSYSSAIGPSGLASPRGSDSGQPVFMMGARYGKGRRRCLTMVMMTTMQRCCRAMSLNTPTSGSVLESCGALGLTSNSHTGGRINESDHRNDGYDEYAQWDSGTGIPAPGLMTGRVMLATMQMAMEQGGVNMIPFDDMSLRNRILFISTALTGLGMTWHH